MIQSNSNHTETQPDVAVALDASADVPAHPEGLPTALKPGSSTMLGEATAEAELSQDSAAHKTTSAKTGKPKKSHRPSGARPAENTVLLQRLSGMVEDLWKELGQDARRGRLDLEKQLAQVQQQLDQTQNREIELEKRVRDLENRVERLLADKRQAHESLQQSTRELEQAVHEQERLARELRISEHSAGIDVQQTEARLRDDLRQAILSPLKNIRDILEVVPERTNLSRDVRKLVINFNNLCNGLRRKGIFGEREIGSLDPQRFTGGEPSNRSGD